jgi:prepilin-type N-terminal cleavage/methylation domain-containing protein
MKNLYKQKRAEGFTIIEVLIVLAIAALILLIVFLAVPALQRNSRNNAIKNDASNLLAAVNDYVANNSGKLPTVVSGSGTGTITFGTAPAVTSEAKTQGATTVTLNGAWPAGAGAINIATNNKCTSPTTVAANPRSVAAEFRIENSSTGTPQQQCLES